MSIRGVLQLQKVILSYCKHGGSSQGIRTLLSSKPYLDYKKSIEPVVIEEKIRNGKHPLVIGKYIHGREKSICVKNFQPAAILQQIERLRNSRGFKARTWVEKKRIVTKRPSIQGQWTPYMKFERKTEIVE